MGHSVRKSSSLFSINILFIYFVLFETGSHYLAQAGLKVKILCFSLPNAGITDVNQLACLATFLYV
jgi:hypothetical protein